MFPLALPTKTTKSIKIRIFVDFTDLPFKNGTAHTKISIFKNLRGPSAAWSLVDVGRGGVHVVYMWYAVGVSRVCTVYVRCRHVCMHVVRVWCECGTHVACTWCGRGMHAVRTWYARGMHVVCA